MNSADAVQALKAMTNIASKALTDGNKAMPEATWIRLSTVGTKQVLIETWIDQNKEMMYKAYKMA